MVVQNNSNNGINSFGIKACNTANLHTFQPENSVILFSANLGLERRWIRRKTKDYSLHRALRREILLQKSKVMSCNVWTFLSVL